MTSWTDKTGRTLEVLPAGDDNPARLVITLPGIAYHPAAFWLDASTDLAEVAVALFAANGKPAPVITPRPHIDPRFAEPFGPYLSLAVSGRRVRVGTQGDVTLDELEPHAARALAGLLVAFADAAEQEPDPAGVQRLADLIAAANPNDDSREAALAIAVALLRKGVTLPGGDARDA